MLTLADCIALSELSAEEVAAIADHEHCADIIAAELGNYLIHRTDGTPAIGRFIRDDIRQAIDAGDYPKAARLRLVLMHFLADHPTRTTA